MTTTASIATEVSSFYAQMEEYFNGVTAFLGAPGSFPLPHFEDITLVTGEVCESVSQQFSGAATGPNVGTLSKVAYDIASLKREAVCRGFTKSYMYAWATTQAAEVGRSGPVVNTILGNNPGNSSEGNV